MANIKYEGRAITIAIDGKAVVELPPRVFRGRLTGQLFEPEKAFLLPGAIKGMRGLKQFADKHPALPLLVTGHTDRPGAAAYNLKLSLDRAKVVAAFLQDKPDDWLGHYKGSTGSMRWGAREDQYMLATSFGGKEPYYVGPFTGKDDQPTKDALEQFQTASGLAASGTADDATRKALVLAYMKQEGTTLAAGTVVEAHGCGEGHPEVETDPGAEEARNRRVEIFIFEGKKIDPAPSEGCAPGGCAQYPIWVKRTVQTVDLEDEAVDLLEAFLELEMVDVDGKPARGVKWKVTTPSGDVREGVLDGSGKARLDGIARGLCKVSFPELDPDAWDPA